MLWRRQFSVFVHRTSEMGIYSGHLLPPNRKPTFPNAYCFLFPIHRGEIAEAECFHAQSDYQAAQSSGTDSQSLFLDSQPEPPL